MAGETPVRHPAQPQDFNTVVDGMLEEVGVHTGNYAVIRIPPAQPAEVTTPNLLASTQPNPFVAWLTRQWWYPF